MGIGHLQGKGGAHGLRAVGTRFYSNRKGACNQRICNIDQTGKGIDRYQTFKTPGTNAGIGGNGRTVPRCWGRQNADILSAHHEGVGVMTQGGNLSRNRFYPQRQKEKKEYAAPFTVQRSSRTGR